MTPTQFQNAVGLNDLGVALWYGVFQDAMAEFKVNQTPVGLALFISQFAHESNGLKVLEENLNYSAEALTQIFRKRFPTLASAQPFHRKPEKIANYLYGSRNGNGTELSGDGYKYRGRGPIQITFANNYQEFAKAAPNANVVEKPELLASNNSISARSACWFWSSHGCNELTTLDAVSDVINLGHRTLVIGDSNGYADRLSRFAIAKRALGI